MTPNSVVLAVDEDWSDGGAGNALGTFYAYEKACRKAASLGEYLNITILHHARASALPLN
jgi:hypothetical protein